MITALDHIAVAVPDLEKAIRAEDDLQNLVVRHSTFGGNIDRLVQLAGGELERLAVPSEGGEHVEHPCLEPVLGEVLTQAAVERAHAAVVEGSGDLGGVGIVVAHHALGLADLLPQDHS